MRRWAPSISLSIWSAGRLTKRDEISARSVSNLNRSSNSVYEVSEIGDNPLFYLESAGSFVFTIKILGIPESGSVHTSPKPLSIQRFQKQMEMIIHDALNKKRGLSLFISAGS